MRDDGAERDRRATALLDAVGTQGGGRLKVFLGAAPGVGKTFAMLQTAQAARRDDLDVVVGIVETHGRVETAALLEGLPVLPRRAVTHRGQSLAEFDLDAVLARRPALVLVDELAHSNAPGSRHPKRFLDVEELLAAGIDVYTTLNVQHVESLNDVVAQITRVRVRETVPDRILDRADEIELVDLTPDDLMRRLRDGKVYLPHNAERALKHYFSPGNLTALRELALRCTAQRVDRQMLQHMRSQAIPGPWAASEHILVCVDEQPGSAGLVRHAKRLADRLRASWTAVHVDDARDARLSEAERDRLAETIRLAQHLDGETVRLPAMADGVAVDLLGYAREINATQILVGRSRRQGWLRRRSRLVQALVDGAGEIGVTVMGTQASETADPPTFNRAKAAATSAPPLAFGIALAAVAAALGVALLARSIISLQSVDLVFLTAVIAVATRFGTSPSLFAALLSSLAYNFFFLPPLYTFTIADPSNVTAFLVFTLVAVLVSNLAARARVQALAAKARTRATEALYAFSRKLGACKTIDDVLWTTAHQIASMMKLRVVLLLPEERGLLVRAGYPPEDELDEADVGAASWAFANRSPAGRGADTLPGAKRLFLPMQTGRGIVGVVGLDDDGMGPILSPDTARLLAALSDQSALAIERTLLMEDLERAKLTAETDRLRQALLTSISHDLKTPLAAVFGAAGTLRDLGSELDAGSKADLLDTIIAESERLNRFIANLLDMTRLEAGAVQPNASPQDLGEIVGATIRRAGLVLAGHPIEIDLDADLPQLHVDPVLLEQALFNLLDNAGKYGAPESAIRIEGRRVGPAVMLRVLDSGPGVPPDDMDRIFDKFYRARKGDSVRAGTGLGLSIARGFVEAMGGSLAAANRPEASGAAFTLSLPVPSHARSWGNAA